MQTSFQLLRWIAGMNSIKSCPLHMTAHLQNVPGSNHWMVVVFFWRRDRFRLVGYPINVTLADWEPRHEFVHHEDRVMLAVALEDTQTNRVLVAASVHLMRNPEDTGKDPMRMLEVSQMMGALSCMVAQTGASGLVIMGDFNAVPQSFTHLFMLHGWQECAGSGKKMQGAFDDVKWDDEHSCTTRTMARSMWIDYIFYSSATLELAGAPHVEPCPSQAIPDDVHPSDHLPLQAALRFRHDARPSLHCSCMAPSHAESAQYRAACADDVCNKHGEPAFCSA